MNTTTSGRLEGKFVVAYTEGVAEISSAFQYKALDLLEENGIPEPRPDEQYPIEAFVDALASMADSVGPATTCKVGSSMTQHVEWPSDVESVEAGFETLSGMHRRVHGNADEDEIGRYEFERTGDGEGRAAVSSNYPYPEPFARGVIEGTLDEFTPDASLVRVVETDARGDEKCAYELYW